MESIRETQINIRKVGRILTVICKITCIICIIIAFIGIASSVAALYIPNAVDHIQFLYQTNTVFQILNAIAHLGNMEPRYVAAIGSFIAALTFLVLFFYIRAFQKVLSGMVEREKPFQREMGPLLRKKLPGLAVLLLYNPVFAIVIFLMALLFSYLLEYGGFIQERADQTNRIQEEMIISFAEITENKSGQTGQHIRRVSEYSKILAMGMGLNEEESENLRLASTMHDIGKLMIPTEILEKPGKLTDEEYKIIKTHTTYGGELLKNVEGDVMGLAREVALEHHERPDGRGYPEGKEDISLVGKIVAVADVYDALTSKRSYKEAWEEDRAYQEIVNGAGTQFDEDVVKAFQEHYAEIQEVRERYKD